MPEAFRTDEIAFLDPLVDILSSAVTETAGSSPGETGQITSRIKIDIFNLTLALTSALIPTLTDVVKENTRAILPNSEVIGESDELRNSMKGILADALRHNSSSPTLNYGSLKEIIKRALLPTPHDDNRRGCSDCTGRGGGIFSCCCQRRNHEAYNSIPAEHALNS